MMDINSENYRIELDRRNLHVIRLIRDGFLINDQTYLSFACIASD